MGKIAVLEVTGEYKDDSVRKNQFIIDSEEPYLLIWNGNKEYSNIVLDCIEQDNWLGYGEVIAVCAGPGQDAVQLSMESVLECFSLEIVGLLFRKDILVKSGGYNTKLMAMTDFELLCRLIETNGNGLVVFPGVEETEWRVTKEELFTCAYLMRRYLNEMHAWGIMESVLQQMYFVAEQSNLLAVFQEYMNEMISGGYTYQKIAADTAPFLIFRGDETCFGVLRDFADSLADELQKLGQAVLLVEPGKTDYEYLQNHVSKAIIGFQAGAMEKDFFKQLQGPKLQFWFDNPVFYEEHFRTISEECYVLCHDKDYAEYISGHYQMKNVCIMPPAGHAQVWQESERPHDIVYIGKYLPETEVQLEGEYKQYYEYMLSHPNLTFIDGLKGMLQEMGRQELVSRSNEIFRNMNPLCQRVINHYKKKVIETILEAGYEIHVYGESWNNYESPYAYRLIKHPEVSVEESLQEWRKAKIGLNIMSWHKAGMTERIANIMLSGAVCLSDETSYLREHFTEEQLVTFRLDCLDELPLKIEKILQDDNWEKIAHYGYRKAMQEHTWERRAKQLVDMVDKVWDKRSPGGICFEKQGEKKEGEKF